MQKTKSGKGGLSIYIMSFSHCCCTPILENSLSVTSLMVELSSGWLYPKKRLSTMFISFHSSETSTARIMVLLSSSASTVTTISHFATVYQRSLRKDNLTTAILNSTSFKLQYCYCGLSLFILTCHFLSLFCTDSQ